MLHKNWEHNKFGKNLNILYTTIMLHFVSNGRETETELEVWEDGAEKNIST